MGEENFGLEVIVHVRSCDESVDVWRPVATIELSPDMFLVNGQVPENGIWKVPPGATWRTGRAGR
jgi:hypothetical protein